jgi:hypothetical protein
MERNGDRCAVPFCKNEIFLEKSHRKAHREGGSRERTNIDNICLPHHRMYGRGELLIEGTTENPVFLTADRRPLDARTGFLGTGVGPP